jgi:hypothetical protein
MVSSVRQRQAHAPRERASVEHRRPRRRGRRHAESSFSPGRSVVPARWRLRRWHQVCAYVCSCPAPENTGLNFSLAAVCATFSPGTGVTATSSGFTSGYDDDEGYTETNVTQGESGVQPAEAPVQVLPPPTPARGPQRRSGGGFACCTRPTADSDTPSRGRNAGRGNGA